MDNSRKIFRTILKQRKPVRSIQEKVNALPFAWVEETFCNEDFQGKDVQEWCRKAAVVEKTCLQLNPLYPMSMNAKLRDVLTVAGWERERAAIAKFIDGPCFWNLNENTMTVAEYCKVKNAMYLQQSFCHTFSIEEQQLKTALRGFNHGKDLSINKMFVIFKFIHSNIKK